jgi:hypothetical protein
MMTLCAPELFTNGAMGPLSFLSGLAVDNCVGLALSSAAVVNAHVSRTENTDAAAPSRVETTSSAARFSASTKLALGPTFQARSTSATCTDMFLTGVGNVARLSQWVDADAELRIHDPRTARSGSMDCNGFSTLFPDRPGRWSCFPQLGGEAGSVGDMEVPCDERATGGHYSRAHDVEAYEPREDCRQEPALDGPRGEHRPHCAGELHGAGDGRERDGQRDARRCHSRRKRAGQGAARHLELRRHSGGFARKRAVRPCQGRLHRRTRYASGARRSSRGWNAVPRRNRGDAARAAGEATAPLATARILPCWRLKDLPRRKSAQVVSEKTSTTGST